MGDRRQPVRRVNAPKGQAAQQARGERVARADRVNKPNGAPWPAQRALPGGVRQRAAGPVRDDHKRGAEVLPMSADIVKRLRGIEPFEILATGLDEVGVAHAALDERPGA